VRPKRFMCLCYIWRKACTYLALTITLSLDGPNEIPHGPRHLGVPSGASKIISEPVVRSAQTVHLSCVKISTISKWTESNFHLSLVTSEYHRVLPKGFLRLCFVWCELCTYLAQTLTLSPNGPNDIPHDRCHLGAASRASIMISEPMVCSAQTMHLSCVKVNTI
jgi:hypothetical protein